MTSSFSKRLKQLREANQMTQGQLGDLINTTRQSISNYEMGKREPDYVTLEALADIFNVDMNYLLGKTDKITYIPSSSHRQLSKNEENLINSFNMLNNEGKEKVITYTQDLVDSGKYAKKSLPTVEEMIDYLKEIPMAAFDGKLDIYKMPEEELYTLYKLIKDNE
jgi:transcriptional regulator with XRE-family HTH domain